MGKRPSESTTVMNEIVLPSDSNALGTAFGGRVIAWVDICGAIAAQRHCRTKVVTASMDQVHFHAPIKTGMVASLVAVVTAAFHRSLEVTVEVHSEDPISGERRHCCSARLTFAAVNDDLEPTKVPALILETDEQRALQEQAMERRKARLASRDVTRGSKPAS